MDRNIYRLLLPFFLLIWLIARLGFFTRKIIGYFVINLSPTPKIKKRGRKKKVKQKNYSFIFRILLLPFIGIINFIKSVRRVIATPLGITLIFVFFIGIFFYYSLFLVNITKNLPSPEALAQTQGPLTTEFYDRNGELLYKLYEDKNRSLVKLNDLPPYLVQATIAIEDKNFYHHPGVDILALIRVVSVYLHDGQVQGGSTITQQLIKNTLLTTERTLQRKIKEIILAFWAERIYDKNQILQMYFNEIPYGGPAWGIASAAQTYFRKNPADLTLAEAAYLAGLPASPTVLSPYGSNPELGKDRQREVLRRMVEEKFITVEQAREAEKEELKIYSPVAEIKAPHFVMYVKEKLIEKYGQRAVSQGGLKVTTSLDLKTQAMAEQVVADEVEKLGNLNVTNGAAMVTEAKTGQILAMVGSRNYFQKGEGNFNVTTALRQPGSSIKPITYATAFKEGYSPGTILLDTPVTFKNQWESYSPVNYDSKFHGAVSIRTALAASYNIPAVKTLAVVGIPDMVKTAQEMGITTFNDPKRYGLSLTLGGGEVKLIDMMSVYGTFANLGEKKEIQPILKIVDANGKVIEDHTKNEAGKRVLSEAVSYMVANILADNQARSPAFGTNSLLNIPGHTVAVKTGTTDNKRDNWTFGFTPELVVGVWVGNNNNAPMNPQLSSGITGAAPIWNKIMTQLLVGKTDLSFKRPANVVEGMVDGHKDLVIAGQQSKSMVARKQNRTDNPSLNRENITYTDPFSGTLPQEVLTP